MREINIKCPNCGANLDIPEDRDTIYCQYCGTLAYSKVDSKTVKVKENITRDDTRIKELEYQKYIYDQEQERRARESVKSGNRKILIIACVLFFLAGVWANNPQTNTLGGAVGLVSIILFIIFGIKTFKSRK